jgi:hypothetical protein
MNLLPCPICGNTDVQHEREAGDCCVEYYTEYECFRCGDETPTFRTKESWNRYAAAMTYTNAMVSRQKAMKLTADGHVTSLNNIANTYTEAKEQALKVFTELA